MYASQIWSPSTAVDQKKLEKVQHSFIRALSFKIKEPMSYLNHDYSELASRFEIPSLVSLRSYYDLVFLFKVLNGLVDSPQILSSFNFRVPGRLLRNSGVTFAIPHSHCFVREKSVVLRLSHLANEFGDIDFFVPFYVFKKEVKNNVLSYD